VHFIYPEKKILHKTIHKTEHWHASLTAIRNGTLQPIRPRYNNR